MITQLIIFVSCLSLFIFIRFVVDSVLYNKGISKKEYPISNILSNLINFVLFAAVFLCIDITRIALTIAKAIITIAISGMNKLTESLVKLVNSLFYDKTEDFKLRNK